jgi:predicted ATP-grasp superfamily ATP-dependent carboligase
MTARPTVLVSPTSSDAGVVMMRQLAAAGLACVGADDGGLPGGMRSRYCRTYRRSAEAKGRKVDEYAYLPDLVEAVRPDILMPLDTPATLAAVRHHERIAAVTRTNLPALDSFMAAYDKKRCQTECRSIGIPCPELYSLDEARTLVRDGRGETTVVVKPDMDCGAGRGVRYVREANGLEEAVRTCQADYGGAIIQEFIPGDVSQQRMVLMLFSPESRLMAAFTSRKLRQWPAGGGATVVSESTAEAHLVEQMLPFFERWRWRGPAEVDLKFDHRDGRFKVLEINPRFPGYLRFVPHCGLDMPLLAATLALDPGSATPAGFPSYSVGVRFLCPGLFGKSVLEEITTGGAWFGTWTTAARELHGTSWVLRELLADPLPPLGRMLFGSV